MNRDLTPDCLDAETLAAWEDGGLDNRAMAAAEAHVSTCARCQALVAVSLKSAPVTVVDASPSVAWWKWLAPVAAGAAAVTLWMVVPEQREVAMAPPAADTVKPQSAERAAASTPALPAEGQPPASPPPDQAANARREGFAAAARDSRADKAESAARDRKAEAPRPLAEAMPPPVAAPPVPATTPAPAPAVALQRSRLQAPSIEVVSPVAAQRWRTTATGIERSEDGGTSWMLVRPSAGEGFTAGTSPSPRICWFVGQAGAVLLTTDGSTFARVDVPDKDDVVAISAVDGVSATVTMASGRRFSTTDGGRTWR